MKSRTVTSVTAMTLFAALSMSARLAAQEQQQKKEHTRYKLIDIGTFGGPASFINAASALGAPNQINQSGAAVGASATTIPIFPDSNLSICGGDLVPFVTHAFEWRKGVVTDLGALPGADTCALATSINARGEIVGQSENGEVDPLTGIRQVRAVLWKDGKVRSLGTFGGNHSIVSNINNHSQVAGLALNAISDPFSIYDLFILGSSNGTQTRAFLWEKGDKRDLGTLGGPDAFAGFVNEHGQVIGISYTDSIPNPTTGIPTVHPFLWEEGRMTDLGSLGGTSGGPSGLNNRGQVIGSSNLEGDEVADPFLYEHGKLIDLFTDTRGGNPITANALNDAGEIVGGGAFGDRPFDAYVLRNGVATDLGFLDGDCFSEAFAINSNGQVVGQSYSCDFTTARVFVWRNGLMSDLQTLIPPDSNLRLANALVINDRGVIGGNGAPEGCEFFEVCGHAYILIPCNDHSEDDDKDCKDGNITAAIPKTHSFGVQRPVDVMTGLSSREIAARIQAKFGKNRGLAVLRRK